MRYMMKQKFWSMGDDFAILATCVVVDLVCHDEDED